MGYQFYARKKKNQNDAIDKFDKYAKYKFDDMGLGKKGGNASLSDLRGELDAITKQAKSLR